MIDSQSDMISFGGYKDEPFLFTFNLHFVLVLLFPEHVSTMKIM